MYSDKPRTPTGKHAKGSVSVIVSHSRLQLRVRYGGKRHYISLGLPDTAENRKHAEMKARQIELDILSDNFDATLVKYKPQAAFTVDSPDITPNVTPKLSELWEKFIEYKQPQCSPNTMKYMYGVYTGYVKRLPTQDLEKASEIRDFSVKNFPLDSAKRFITRLSACCRWAMQAKLISENPFDRMAAEIKLPKSSTDNEISDVNPFSLEERDAIINALETNQFCPKKSGFKHSQYAPLIKFLFLTGCRPSEAIALQWKHIDKDFSRLTFEQVSINTSYGRKIRPGLKTQERRRFPCNTTLKDLLKSIKPEQAHPEDLVFPSPEGKVVDLNNFRNRTWKKILAGLGIGYRKLYQTRHTFITHAIEVGKLDAKDVARLVGNSPEVIYRHYAGNKRDLLVPEF